MDDKFVTRPFLTNSSDIWLYEVQYTIPKKCPHCSIPNSPRYISNVISSYSDNYLQIFVWQCTNCLKKYATFHLRDSDRDKELEFIHIHPQSQSVSFSNLITSVSPRFVEVYQEATTSEQFGNLTVAGIGYRLALEILIKDYAINELKIDESTVINKSLASAISDFLPSINIINAADVVRMKGNDYTHFHEKYTHVNFEIFKEYLDIFISALNLELKMRHPPLARVVPAKAPSNSPKSTPSSDQS